VSIVWYPTEVLVEVRTWRLSVELLRWSVGRRWASACVAWVVGSWVCSGGACRRRRPVARQLAESRPASETAGARCRRRHHSTTASVSRGPFYSGSPLLSLQLRGRVSSTPSSR